MSQLAYSAKPIGRAEIRKLTRKVRQVLGIEKAYFPIVQAVEFALDDLAPGFIYAYPPQSDKRMGQNHGLTIPAKKELLVREDIYRGAANGNPRDRMTIAHELGHAILHGETQLARLPAGSQVPPYMDPEWQAKAFAGELLVDIRFALECRSVTEIMEMFVVSRPAAEIQWREIKKIRQQSYDRRR